MKNSLRNEEEYEERIKEKPFKGFLAEKNVIISSSENLEGLTLRGYGRYEASRFLLSFCEALYLLNKGIIEVLDEKSQTSVSFQDLLEKARLTKEETWMRYLIYRDLRGRGYVVREGFGLNIDFRVYKRGQYRKSKADYLILGIQEGQPMILEHLARIVTRVQSEKKSLILSVLNRRGETVYYSISRLSFK